MLVVACSGATYDPIAEVPHSHREMADTATAISVILAENPTPRVYAIGEYHQSRNAIAKTSPRYVVILPAQSEAVAKVAKL